MSNEAVAIVEKYSPAIEAAKKEVESIVVIDSESYNYASRIYTAISGKLKEVKAEEDKIIIPQKAALKAAQVLFEKVSVPLKGLKETLKGKMEIYIRMEEEKKQAEQRRLYEEAQKKEEEERKRLAEQERQAREKAEMLRRAAEEARRAAEQADKAERERLLAEAKKAEEKAAKMEEKAEEKAEEAEQVFIPVPIVEIKIEKVMTESGSVSTRKNFTFEIIDLEVIPRGFLVPDKAKILAEGKTGREVAGVRFFYESVVISR